MNKKILALATAVVVSIFGNSTVFAANLPKVVFNANKQFVYEGNIKKIGNSVTLLGDEFEGIAPGDTRTQVIELENKSDNLMDFYLAEETIDKLEEANKSSGGAYVYDISVGKNKDSAKSLLNAVAGGYENANSNGSSEGLAEISDLKDYTYVAQLAKNESTNIYLTLTIEGEGNDSTTVVDYSNATAQLKFNFRAYDVNHEIVYGPDTVSTSTSPLSTAKNTLSSFTRKVKTNDVAIASLVLAMIAGIALAGFAIIKKNRKGDE
ncbi:hypothetical protein [Lachnobacterium bovis]|jgi:hypothetical protein|uniref:LPXTG-motif cell wall anchor domain-containing protein n=1 Tax=Lachnobacterium bovis DSM 14045 TaxID=1122142 RepID=A0A1H3GQV1_9FIRM|nr:hypothetical protein [Lachnobacterium bovis]MBQ1802299.1 hypothetical protein [Lachnobacterium sp.]SDY05702.1 hypothetical protein SAMN02910414_00624 [Lachnobacterium bovis DSM 14045]